MTPAHATPTEATILQRQAVEARREDVIAAARLVAASTKKKQRLDHYRQFLRIVLGAYDAARAPRAALRSK